MFNIRENPDEMSKLVNFITESIVNGNDYSEKLKTLKEIASSEPDNLMMVNMIIDEMIIEFNNTISKWKSIKQEINK